MKLAAFRDGSGYRYGIVEGDRVLSPRPGTGAFATLDQFVASGTPLSASSAVPSDSQDFAIDGIKFLPPLADSRFFCIGMNYPKILPDGTTAHAARLRSPAFFLKDPSSLIAHRQPICVPAVSAQLDYEGELAAIIGKGGRDMAPGDVLEHIFGYTIMNDGSVRDWQAHSVSAGKNFYRSGAWGPFVTTADEVGPTDDLRIRTWLNGEIVQDGRVGAMFFPIGEVVSYLSRVTPLRCGDVIAFGSPTGSASSDSSRRYLAAGDHLRIAIDRLGALENTVSGPTPEHRPVAAL